jgi:hypothetical protein
MKKMMNAMQNGSEEDVKKLFEESSSTFENMPGMEGFDMDALKKEMEGIGSDDENDSADLQDVKSSDSV